MQCFEGENQGRTYALGTNDIDIVPNAKTALRSLKIVEKKFLTLKYG